MTNIQSIARKCEGDWGDVEAIFRIEFGKQHAIRAGPDCIARDLVIMKQVVSMSQQESTAGRAPHSEGRIEYDDLMLGIGEGKS